MNVGLSHLEVFINFVKKYKVILFSLVVAAILSVVGWMFNAARARKINAQAHAAWVKLQGSKARGPELLTQAKEVAEQHKGSNYYPFFLAKIADLLAKDGSLEQAVEILSQAVRRMDGTLCDLYTIKLHVMTLDGNDEDAAVQALAKLRGLAHSAIPPISSLASWHLHQYFWANNDFEQALIYANRLLEIHNTFGDRQDSSYSSIEEQAKFNLSLMSAKD